MTLSSEPAGIEGYRCQTHRQPAADGTTLFRRRFIPHGDRPTGRLDIIHGWADHSGRYARLLDALRPLNLEVGLPDLRGHGRSDGRRGHIRRFDDYLMDLAQIFALRRTEGDAEGPRWLLGHSMGGLVAFHLALRFPARYQGIILSAPFMAPLPPLGLLKRRLVTLLSWALPRLSLRREVDPGRISHDPAVAAGYREDPLVHGRLTPRWLAEILTAQAQAPRRAATLEGPLLMQLSPDDTVVDTQAALAIYLRLPAGAKTLRVYPRRGHELYNETPALRSKPLHDLVEWIGERQEAYLMDAAGR